MRKSLAILVIALFPALTARGAEGEDPKAFLAEARAKYCDLTVKGLKSFTAKVELKTTTDAKSEKAKDLLEFAYAWTAPDTEDFSFDPKLQKKTQADMRRFVGRLWIYLSGAIVFPLLETAEGLKMERGEEGVTLAGKLKDFGPSRVTFDPESHRIVEWELSQLKAKITFGFTKQEERLRLENRKSEVGDRKAATSYSGFRKVSGFVLPTLFEVAGVNKYKFSVEYITINGQPAKLEALDTKAIKERVKAFEKGWRKWTPEEKIEQMKVLATELDHDLVSACIAKWGLKDRDLGVRGEAAKCLALMRRKNVTPAMMAAMKSNEKNIEVYLKLIWSLGQLNDPRAVKILSTDWWNQRIGEYGDAAAKAKLEALGNIRHASSVDALIGLFYKTRDRAISHYKKIMYESLKKLTGQDFLYDRKAWKEWWKQNRARHRFD
ncbi:MAG: HEAT repeat domain-containing protein [Planctomycetota bacterium]|jgi:hypothetical protein